MRGDINEGEECTTELHLWRCIIKHQPHKKVGIRLRGRKNRSICLNTEHVEEYNIQFAYLRSDYHDKTQSRSSDGLTCNALDESRYGEDALPEDGLHAQTEHSHDVSER